MTCSLLLLLLLLQTVRDHCFKLCISSPGSSLSSSEQKCLGRCMDRYQDVSY
jgi:import inner membrane translocase subunit TIM13